VAQWYFDPAPTASGSVPEGKADFVSVALHEIGHVLGFSNETKAFERFTAGSHFTGANAVKLFGGRIPLADDLSHPRDGVVSDGHDVLMDPAAITGTRHFPTPLDLAILKDIGYEL
jgi:hypothetical protein